MKLTVGKSCRLCSLCSQDPKSFLPFDKIADLRDIGLVVYRPVIGSSSTRRSRETRQSSFLFHNTTNTDIARTDIIAALEQQYKTSCPRCRSNITYIRMLLETVQKIVRKDIRAICDLCKIYNEKICHLCTKVLKMFTVADTEYYTKEMSNNCRTSDKNVNQPSTNWRRPFTSEQLQLKASPLYYEGNKKISLQSLANFDTNSYVFNQEDMSPTDIINKIPKTLPPTKSNPIINEFLDKKGFKQRKNQLYSKKSLPNIFTNTKEAPLFETKPFIVKQNETSTEKQTEMCNMQALGKFPKPLQFATVSDIKQLANNLNKKNSVTFQECKPNVESLPVKESDKRSLFKSEIKISNGKGMETGRGVRLSRRNRMLPRINVPVIETEILFNPTSGNRNENAYHVKALPKFHVIKPSTPLSTPIVSEIGPLFQVNTKIPKFDVYAVPNVKSFFPILHEVKYEKPAAPGPIGTKSLPMINKNKIKVGETLESDNAEFSFYFHAPKTHNREDELRSSSLEELKKRMAHLRLLARARDNEPDKTRQEGEKRGKEAKPKTVKEVKVTVREQKKSTKKEIGQASLKKVRPSEPDIKNVESMSVEIKKKMSFCCDKRELPENEPAEHRKVRLPLPEASKEYQKKMQNITELVTEESDKLSNETKRKLGTFMDKVDDVEKINKIKEKVEKQIHLPVPLVSGEKIKQDLAKITNWIEGGSENMNESEVKKMKKLLNKLDDIKNTPDDKRVQLPITSQSLKKNLQQITELVMKAPNKLTENESEEINKFIETVDGTAKYKYKIDKNDTKLSQRQQLQALTLASDFTNALKTITHLFIKGPDKLDYQEVENIDKFMQKLDGTEVTRKKTPALKLAKPRESNFRLRTPTLSPTKSVMEKTELKVKDEKERFNESKIQNDVEAGFILNPSPDNSISKFVNDNLKSWQEDKVTAVNVISEGNNKNLVDYRHRLGVGILNTFQEQADVSIFGTEIVPKQYALKRNRSQSINKPLLFQTTCSSVLDLANTSVLDSGTIHLSTEYENNTESRGILRYALSDRTFIDNGWTMKPTEKIIRKLNIYNMRPANPKFDWFKKNQPKGLITYDTGQKFAEFDDNGKCRWYYRNGRIALEYYKPKETNARKRFVIYSTGEPDDQRKPRPYTVLAMFDYIGNGLVLDHTGKTRIKYNQTEGIVLDKAIGPYSHWKWHTLNDPPEYEHIFVEKYMTHKDPKILSYEEQDSNTVNITEEERSNIEKMLAIELDNSVKHENTKSKHITTFQPFKIRMKALKINEYFSLKILDQAKIYLIFIDGKRKFKLDIGMVLDHTHVVDTDKVEVKDVVTSKIEIYPACTESVHNLQQKISHAHHIEQLYHQNRVISSAVDPAASVENLKRAISKPLRRLVQEVPVENTCHCNFT